MKNVSGPQVVTATEAATALLRPGRAICRSPSEALSAANARSGRSSAWSAATAW
jgi:hypothetical protein